MSYRRYKHLSLAGFNARQYSVEELRRMSHESLLKGMHGICFSAYDEGQQPGDQLSEDQVRRKLEILKPYIKWVRTFSCTEGNELIPKVAKELGIKTLVGAWLGDDLEKNETELQGLYALAQQGLVDVAAVGNEVLYRGDLTVDELLGYLQSAKMHLPNVPMGYVDAYYEFSNHPEITAACDVILANCYPFWEGCALEYSLMYMKQMYFEAQHAAGPGKKVIVTETGWPFEGRDVEGAVPNERNALTYFMNAQEWSRSEGVDMFYFSSFDESWKVEKEGDVGAYWGLWDKEERLKF